MKIKILNNNTYKQPINERTLNWTVWLIVIACVLLLLTIAILSISLPNSHISLFEH